MPALEGANPECRQAISEWLTTVDASIAGTARTLEEARPDMLAPVDEQTDFAKKMVALTGQRQLLHQLIIELFNSPPNNIDE